MKIFKYETEYHKGELVKVDYPCFWEQGGFNKSKNTGYAIIVSDFQGNPKKPVFIKKKGSLCNGKHALFPVEFGDLLIETTAEGENTKTVVHKIISIDEKEKELITSETRIPCVDVVEFSVDKALDHNCKTAKFMRL